MEKPNERSPLPNELLTEIVKHITSLNQIETFSALSKAAQNAAGAYLQEKPLARSQEEIKETTQATLDHLLISDLTTIIFTDIRNSDSFKKWLPEAIILGLYLNDRDYYSLCANASLLLHLCSGAYNGSHVRYARASVTENLCGNFLELHEKQKFKTPEERERFLSLLSKTKHDTHPLFRLFSYILTIQTEEQQKNLLDGVFSPSKNEKLSAAIALLKGIQTVLHNVLDRGGDRVDVENLLFKEFNPNKKRVRSLETVRPEHLQNGRLGLIFQELLLCLAPQCNIHSGDPIFFHRTVETFVNAQNDPPVLQENRVGELLLEMLHAQQTRITIDSKIIELIKIFAADKPLQSGALHRIKGYPSQRLFSYEDRMLIATLQHSYEQNQQPKILAALELLEYMDYEAENNYRAPQSFFGGNAHQKNLQDARDLLHDYYQSLRNRATDTNGSNAAPVIFRPDLKEIAPRLRAICDRLSEESTNPKTSSTNSRPS